jgi:hypothetical protein
MQQNKRGAPSASMKPNGDVALPLTIQEFCCQKGIVAQSGYAAGQTMAGPQWERNPSIACPAINPLRRKETEMNQKRTLESLARDSLNRFDGDVDRAVNYLNNLLKDEELRQTIVEAAIAEACKTFVSKVHRDQREAIKSNIVSISSRIAQGAILSVKDNVEQLYAYPLMRGVKLGDATRVEVKEQAEFHGKTAKDAVQKHAWFESIVKRMPDDKVHVRDVLSSEDLFALYEEARKCA